MANGKVGRSKIADELKKNKVIALYLNETEKEEITNYFKNNNYVTEYLLKVVRGEQKV